MDEKLTINKPEKQNNSIIWIAVVVLLFLLVLAVGFKFKEFKNSHPAMQATLDETCDLHKGSCRLVFPDGGSVSLSISPNNIPLLERLQLRVELEKINASKVEIDFTGIGIDMGYNRPELKAISKTTFVSDGFLPVCTFLEMDWSAKVLVHTDKGLMMAPYKFHTSKKSTIYDLLK